MSQDLGLSHPKVPGSFQDPLQPASKQIISTKSDKYQNETCKCIGSLIFPSVLIALVTGPRLEYGPLLRQRMGWPRHICSQHQHRLLLLLEQTWKTHASDKQLVKSESKIINNYGR